MVASTQSEVMEVVSDPKLFKESSGNLLERLIFNHRLPVMIICALLTAFFAFQLRGLSVTASYDKMLPYSHPYIKNFIANRGELKGLGDTVRVVVAKRSVSFNDSTVWR